MTFSMQMCSEYHFSYFWVWIIEPEPVNDTTYIVPETECLNYVPNECFAKQYIYPPVSDREHIHFDFGKKGDHSRLH